MMMRAGHRGQGDVVLGDGPGRALWSTRSRTSGISIRPEGVVDGLDRAHHVGLDDQRQLLELALADPGEQVLQARGPAGRDGRLRWRASRVWEIRGRSARR
jgi:hypothetical protein